MENPNKDYDVLHKIVLIGDSAVGKTSLLQRFAEQQFQDTHISTIGVDFKLRTIQVENTRVKLQVWDTAGQEKFRVITKAYYRNAAGIIIVYDITNAESFVNTQRWIQEVKDNCGDDGVAIILVGNKCDAADRRAVNFEDEERYAQGMSLPFYEASAKENVNIDEIFIHLTRLILARQERLKERTQPTNSKTSHNSRNISLTSPNTPKPKGKNCCSK